MQGVRLKMQPIIDCIISAGFKPFMASGVYAFYNGTPAVIYGENTTLTFYYYDMQFAPL